MKKIILFFLVFIANVQFAFAQCPDPSNPLGLEFDGSPTIISCSSTGRPICKMKIKINNIANFGGEFHIYADIGPVGTNSDYHEHLDISANMEFEFIGKATASRDLISLRMFQNQCGDSSDSKIVLDFPPTISMMNPELIVKASNNFIEDADWEPLPKITSASTFGLVYNNHFYINLYSSKQVLNYSVAVRQNSTGLTRTNTYSYVPIYGNPRYTNVDIVNMFTFLHMQHQSSGGNSYTVTVAAKDCQGNVADTKSFEVNYTYPFVFPLPCIPGLCLD